MISSVKAGTTSVFIVLFFLVSLELNTDLMKEWMNEQWIYLYSYTLMLFVDCASLL